MSQVTQVSDDNKMGRMDGRCSALLMMMIDDDVDDDDDNAGPLDSIDANPGALNP